MRTIALLAGCAVLAAADPAVEFTAWSPYADDRSSLHAAENRPFNERRWIPIAQAWALGGTRERFDGLVSVQRDGALVDGQVAFNLSREIEDAGWYPGAVVNRAQIYVRTGSDALAAEADVWQVVAGAAILSSLGGGPNGAWIEIGHSEERGTLVHLEAMLWCVHLVSDVSDRRRSLRGLCLRWPGRALARTVQEDPWSFTLDLDWAHSSLDAPMVPGTRDSTSCPLARLALAWRFTNHMVVATQVEAAETLRVDGTTGGQVTATVGLGVTF
jgi:hypothetical protein